MEDYDLASTLTETKCDVLGYTVLAMIDYGSFGDVFKVKNHANNQMCALKQIRFKRDFRNDPYIINELYCLTHLTHKNVVKLYEIIIEDGEINIVMEYAEKENLQRYLTLNDKLEFHQKYKIYSQVLEGMKYCHSMDVAHRDMTPSNVLLNADMVVKIADFGLAVRCFTIFDNTCSSMEDDLATTLTETKCDVLGYTVLAMIDYGSFGDVFKVKNHANNQMCALKQIRFKRDFKNDPYIMNELYCLTHLTHKNVVKLYEIIIEDGEINIVMEYAEKENLQRYLTLNDKLEFHQKYKIYSQVLEGMKYCHSMDVAHRDMTPSNVLLNADMVVKIADFGLAVRCFTKQGDPVECTDYLGHASYLAPEVLSQKPFRPKPTDIWSLGITLIYILFRDTPYHGFESDILEDQLKHSWRDFVGRKAIDQDCIVQDDVTEFIKKALELDPNRRCNICDLVRRWDAIDPTTTNSSLISFPNTDAF